MLNKKKFYIFFIIFILIATTGIYIELNEHKQSTVYVSAYPEETNLTQGSCLLVKITSSPTCISYYARGWGNCKNNMPDIAIGYLGNNSSNKYLNYGSKYQPVCGYERPQILPFKISSAEPAYLLHWNLTWENSRGNYTMAPAGYYELFYIQGNICVTDFGKTSSYTDVNYSVNHEEIFISGISANANYNNTTAEIRSCILGQKVVIQNTTITLETKYFNSSDQKFVDHFKTLNYSILSTEIFNLTLFFGKYYNQYGGFRLYFYIRLRIGEIKGEANYIG